MIRMRTAQQAYEELKKQDPNTAMTTFRIRRLIKEGIIPHVAAGRCFLINMDGLEEYLKNPSGKEIAKEDANSRRIFI